MENKIHLFILSLNISNSLSLSRERERERERVGKKKKYQTRSCSCVCICIYKIGLFPLPSQYRFSLHIFSTQLKYQPLSHTTIPRPEQRIFNEHCYCKSTLRKILRQYAFFIKLNVLHYELCIARYLISGCNLQGIGRFNIG